MWQDDQQQDATHSTREEYALWPASAHLPVLQQRLCEQVPNEEAHGVVHNEEKLKELICRRVPSTTTTLHQVPRDCQVHQHVLRKEASNSEMLNVQPNISAHIWAEKPYSKTLGQIRAVGAGQELSMWHMQPEHCLKGFVGHAHEESSLNSSASLPVPSMLVKLAKRKGLA